MAPSNSWFILALLLLNTACPAAGASVMRVHEASIKAGGEVEMMQTESLSGLSGLTNMFADDDEASATANLLMLAEGTPSDDLLPFVQKLKNQIQPWHDDATAKLKAAIEEVKACTGEMENGMRDAQAEKDSCTAESTSHTTHRKDERSKFSAKEQAKANEVEKKEEMTTECNAFKAVKDEVHSATATYGGGDEGAYLESVSQQFCSGLLPRYKEAKQKCTTATAEHTEASETYETKNTAYTVQKSASDTVQTEMDETCCEYALATKGVCTSHATCYEDKVAAYKVVKAIIEGEEKVKKVEWRVYSRIECLLPVLGTDNAAKIEECRAKEHSTSHLDIEYPDVPEKVACQTEQAYPGTEAYKAAHFGNLPDEAKGKSVAVCAGMTTSENDFVAQASCKPKSTATGDAGYNDGYRGWYDVQGCGKCLDYCRWVGNSGSGGSPQTKLTHGSSWWSCRLAGDSATYSGKGHFSSWSYTKCSGEGAEAPKVEVPNNVVVVR